MSELSIGALKALSYWARESGRLVGDSGTVAVAKAPKAGLRVAGGAVFAGDVEIDGVYSYTVEAGPGCTKIVLEAFLHAPDKTLREAAEKFAPWVEDLRGGKSGEDPMELTRAMCGGSRKRERP